MTTATETAVQAMKARLLDRNGLERLAERKAGEQRETKRDHHETQCTGVKLDTRVHRGRRWFRCTGCEYVFHEFTEGAAALVRKAGA